MIHLLLEDSGISLAVAKAKTDSNIIKDKLAIMLKLEEPHNLKILSGVTSEFPNVKNSKENSSHILPH